ncbi:MAG: hypothetical protein IKC31_01415 [Clostridia bacterium]|nr:hypothetical protein [Clostridia bacterium]
MKFGATETLLKRYDEYTKSDNGVDSLIVTDKRIIRLRELKTFRVKRTVREEIRTQDVISVNSRVEVSRRGGFLAACIVFSVLAIFALAAFFVLRMFEAIPPFVPIICIAGAVALFLLGIIFLLVFLFSKRIAFQLLLATNQMAGTQMAIGTTAGMQVVVKKVSAKQLAKDASKGTIDAALVETLAEEIGALIVQAQDKASVVKLTEMPALRVSATASEPILIKEIPVAPTPVAPVYEEETEEIIPEKAEEEIEEEIVEEAATEIEEEIVEEPVEEAVEEAAAEIEEEIAEETAEEPAGPAIAAFEESPSDGEQAL